MTSQAMVDVHDTQIRALEERRAQLEHRVAHYGSAVRECDGHDPPLGRELDAASSLLAEVRASRCCTATPRGSRSRPVSRR